MSAISSLSAAFSQCNSTGLAWLSPEARVVYNKALEVITTSKLVVVSFLLFFYQVLAHCEKLETTLIQVLTRNPHLKLPFIVGKNHDMAPLKQDSTKSEMPFRSKSDSFHPFHAARCPYCTCDWKPRGQSLYHNHLMGRGANADYCHTSGKFSSSGIASKSITPPNHSKDFPIRFRMDNADGKSSLALSSMKESQECDGSCCLSNRKTTSGKVTNEKSKESAGDIASIMFSKSKGKVPSNSQLKSRPKNKVNNKRNGNSSKANSVNNNYSYLVNTMSKLSIANQTKTEIARPGQDSKKPTMVAINQKNRNISNVNVEKSVAINKGPFRKKTRNFHRLNEISLKQKREGMKI